MKTLHYDEFKLVAGGEEISAGGDGLGGSGGGSGSGGNFGGGNLMDQAGLNSSGAFSGIDRGNYNGDTSPSFSSANFWDSLLVGVTTVATDCAVGIAEGLAVAKVVPILFPAVTLAPRETAAIGCGVGITSGVYKELFP